MGARLARVCLVEASRKDDEEEGETKMMELEKKGGIKLRRKW